MSSDDCYDKAVDLLARRPHFRGALAAKLTARGFTPDDVERVCDRLEENGLLNDLESARGLVEGSWRRRGYGRARMRAELERRRVAGEVIDAVLRQDPGKEIDLAETTARRWLERRRPADGAARRLAGHLSRKGFAGEVVYEVLRRLEGELGPGPSRHEE